MSVTTFQLTDEITRDYNGRKTTSPGARIAPGLAVVAAKNHDEDTIPRRYQILVSSDHRAFPSISLCAEHTSLILWMFEQTDINWDQPAAAITEAIRGTNLLQQLTDDGLIRSCRPRYGCPGDPEQPDPAEARCLTCGAEFEPDEERDDVSAKAAKNWASDHECTPELQISLPGEHKWRPADDIDWDGNPRTPARPITTVDPL